MTKWSKLAMVLLWFKLATILYDPNWLWFYGPTCYAANPHWLPRPRLISVNKEAMLNRVIRLRPRKYLAHNLIRHGQKRTLSRNSGQSWPGHKLLTTQLWSQGAMHVVGLYNGSSEQRTLAYYLRLLPILDYFTWEVNTKQMIILSYT